MSSAIEISGLTKAFATKDGPVEAVKGIDLAIDTGQIVALLGPNGAGKTTTLDIVLGLTEPTSGTVQVLGAHPRKAVIEGHVSAVLQTGGLLSDISVRETMDLIASTFDKKASVDDVLARVGITHLANRRVSKCSGGEQQRLRFALSLIPDPKLLILDEPTAGMDVNARREFWDTMQQEAKSGRTVVFATHYLQEADDFAERIVLVANGRVIADGSTAEIRAKASGRVVTATLTDPETARRALEPHAADIIINGQRMTIRASDSDAVARLLLTELGGRDLEIHSGSLEDAFVQLTSDSEAVAR